ncbi:unnamed protein product [Brassica napus]|uniref:(rape) hypothetical protein n=1 Tax=Brassica napus TaxID=3708 RepID=A0A816QZX9_BRANA|nr:unnamed protein product [Brassica napus]
MESLKRSLGIPERLGWEADPCTPSSWEGVTCITDPIGQGFVIYEMNLSSNCLIGEISSLVNTNLVKLVSGNKGLCGVGIPSLPQCSLWTMVLHTKLSIGGFLWCAPYASSILYLLIPLPEGCAAIHHLRL